MRRSAFVLVVVLVVVATVVATVDAAGARARDMSVLDVLKPPSRAIVVFYRVPSTTTSYTDVDSRRHFSQRDDDDDDAGDARERARSRSMRARAMDDDDDAGEEKSIIIVVVHGVHGVVASTRVAWTRFHRR